MTVLTACDAATEIRPRIEHNVVFMDKRVIPPFRRHEGRITGTIHMPGSPRQSDRPRPTNAAAV